MFKYHIAFILLASFSFSQVQYSWRYYRPGNTGIQGDNAEALWIANDGDPYIAAYTAAWEEGGFAKYIQSENRWINYSNVNYPVMGRNIGSSRISDIEEAANGILWMATWRGLLRFNPNIGGSSIFVWSSNNSVHPGGRTLDIAVAPDGSIWAAVTYVSWGNGGLVNYNPNTNVWRYWGSGVSSNNWPPNVFYTENVSVQRKPSGGYLVWIQSGTVFISFDSDTQ
ncbi:MAG: hypothetical protein N2510_10235, partial [Ignavibacteria bacterium]|nr:hypothetical protein [Ignavibacteria bacterium]